VVIVEAAQKGGALITADIANSYNKDVFAYPGNIGQSHSAGCNNLIKSNRANLITGVKDLEYIMNWEPHTKPVRKEIFSIESFDPNEQLVIRNLQDNNKQTTLDELSWRTNLPVSQLASVLLNLEFKGVVKALPGKVFRLTTKD
jgi:DNA processing protein